jgi:YegS/Rv2252/BmrU family lipid kinase
VVVFNPTAGSRDRAAALENLLRPLRQDGRAVEVRPTAAAGDGERLARAAAEGALCDLLVVAGGDGTINEVINGLAAAGEGAAGLPLAVLPFGTANVLAAELGLRSRADAVRAILTGRTRPAHTGLANGRRFTMMAGVGFDAHVVRGIDPAVKRRLGRGAYGLEMLRQLARYPFPRYGVTIDGTTYEAASVVVAKGHFYGGRYICAPAARLDEASFEVCLFERGGRAAAVSYALALGSGRLARRRDYRIVTGRAIRIEGPAGDPVQADGEIVATLPVDIALAPHPLLLRLPV